MKLLSGFLCGVSLGLVLFQGELRVAVVLLAIAFLIHE